MKCLRCEYGITEDLPGESKVECSLFNVINGCMDDCIDFKETGKTRLTKEDNNGV